MRQLLLLSLLCACYQHSRSQDTTPCMEGELQVAEQTDGFIGGNYYVGGRVEVCYNGVYHPVCDVGWDNMEAAVMCRLYGYPAPSYEPEATYGEFNQSNESPVLPDLMCSGTEYTLSDCPGYDLVEALPGYCGENQAGARCVGVPTPCSDGDIQFADTTDEYIDGETYYSGRVEVCYDEVYRPVCGNGWDDRAAAVICNYYGYSSNYAEATYNVSYESPVLPDLMCNGTESLLSECPGYDLGDVPEGYCFLIAGVRCVEASTPCSDGDMQLADQMYGYIDGNSYFGGRVEVCFNEEYRPLCGEEWNNQDAAVVCNYYGYSSYRAEATYNQSDESVIFVNLMCNGTEYSLSECSVYGVLEDPERFCGNQASVRCVQVATICFDGDIRIADDRYDYIEDEYYYGGRVEVCYNEVYHPVCDLGWGDHEAAVICNYAGYTRPTYRPEATTGSTFGLSDEDSVLQNLRCNGSEFSLSECPGYSLGSTTDGYCEDTYTQAGVRCVEVPTPTTPCYDGSIRLAEERRDYTDDTYSIGGRVEVCSNGTYGPICDEGWDDQDAAVACNALGYGPPVYRSEATDGEEFGLSQEIPVLQGLMCDGTEYDLSYCSGYNLSAVTGDYCLSGNFQAGVRCIEQEFVEQCYNDDGTIEFVDEMYSYGNDGDQLYVEALAALCVDGVTRTICDANWNDDLAAKFCTYYGYGGELYTPSALYGLSGPDEEMWIGQLVCNESSQCSYDIVPLSQTQCNSTERAAGVRCEAIPGACSSDGDVRARNRTYDYSDGGLLFTAYVEICEDSMYGLVCASGWTDTEAEVLCKREGYYPPYYGARAVYEFLEDGDTREFAANAINCSEESIYSFYDCEIDYDVSDECQEERVYAAVECYEVCPGGDFVCGNGECVQYSFTCDGHIDCSDGSDEDSSACGSGSGSGSGDEYTGCREDEYMCPDGTCIDEEWVCDGYRDCSDGADESDCDLCSALTFMCESGEYIPEQWVCDDREDCADGSDEFQGCSPVTGTAADCEHGEFQCYISGSCRPSTDWCDGRAQCSDLSDELCCESSTCADDQEGQFRLANISISDTEGGNSLVGGRVEICHERRYGSVCDLNWDNSDAQVACTNFFGTGSDYTFEGEGVGMSYFGVGDGEVLAENVQCDGTEAELLQCGLEDNLGSVSDVCQYGRRSAGIICHVEGSVGGDIRECDSDEFQCASGRCIPQDNICNDQNDCGDFSDERLNQCEPQQAPSGPPSDFRMSIGNSETIVFLWNPVPEDQRNGQILSYEIRCEPSRLLKESVWTFDRPTVDYAVSGFIPGVNYTCFLSAMNAVGWGPATMSNITMPYNLSLPFIVLDGDPGVVYLDRIDDGSSDPINIPSGAPMGNSVQTTAYVGTNGIISFGEPWYFWSPSPFPTSSYYSQNSYVVAPYWSDVDIRREGSVYYRVVTRNTENMAANSSLQFVDQFISNYTQVNFTSSWMLVATWEGVHSYPHGSGYSQDSRANTFQGIVTTDGNRTYAVFTHRCNCIQWGGSAVVGYNLNGVYSKNFALSGQPDIVDIDCLSDTGWTSIIYNLTVSTDEIQQQKALCYGAYGSDIDKIGMNLSYYLDVLLPCPCSYWQAIFDNRFRFDDNSSNCFFQRFNSSRGGSQYCCYSFSSNTFGALLSASAGVRGSSMLLHHPTANTTEYLERDLAFRRACCGAANLCDLFYERRPADDCRGYEPPFWGWGFGDPHFTTLDGRSYTFNGWGEYILLDIEDSISIQARTELVPNTQATQFSAIAVGTVYDKLEVGKQDGELTVLSNGDDITSSLQWVNDSVSSSLGQATRTDQHTILLVSPAGISVNVSLRNGVLDYVIALPESFKDTTKGLLGNFNGNPDDDLMSPDGSQTLPSDASDAQIHNIGQQWQVNDGITLFTYPDGMSSADFAHPDHQPDYLTEVVQSASADIVSFCNNDPQCIFDYAETMDETVAQTTMEVDRNNTQNQEIQNNTPPRMTGPSVLEITVGMAASYTFTVTDDDSFTVDLDNMPAGSQLLQNGEMYTFQWTVNSIDDVVPLTFYARDSMDATSVLSPRVNACACQNNGECTSDGATVSDNVANLNCLCSQGWTGRYCEDDANGCAFTECYDGVECFDVPAPGVGATCGPCPDGFTGDGEKCADIDECNTTSVQCAHMCTNTIGSYECTCREGYYPNPSMPNECEDVNECSSVNDCDQICSNTDGSYTCSCRSGFILDNDRRTCLVLGTNRCPDNNACSDICTLVNNVATCDCRPGYMLQSDGQNCEDIDECDVYSDICQHQCTNTVGSYNCSCRSGYVLSSDGRTCIDINECAMTSTTCTEPRLCSNTEGSFSCVCPPGTEEGSNGVCEVVTVPEPTRVVIPVPPTSIPSAVDENSVKVSLSGYTKDTFTDSVQLQFKQVTARVITDYCSQNEDECKLVNFARKRRAALVITASHVQVYNIDDAGDNQVQFSMYLLVNSEQVLSGSALRNSVEGNSAAYEEAGFMVGEIEEQTSEEDDEFPTTLVIAASAGGSGAILCLITTLLLCCIICMKKGSPTSPDKKGIDISGMESQQQMFMNEEAFQMESGVVGGEDSTAFKPKVIDDVQEEGFVNPLHD